MRMSKTAQKAVFMLEKFMSTKELRKLMEEAEEIAKSRKSPWIGFRHLVQVVENW